MRGMSLSPSHLNTQVQHKKIFCAYHPTQFLTNFCLEKQCLMPLCPSCVVQHTQEHYQVKQKPTYINLNEALSQVRNKCYSQVSELQEYHRVNQEITNYIEGLKLYIRKQLNICKQNVFQHITLLFEQYEDTLYKQIAEKYKEDQVYDFHESKQVKNSILQNIQSLYEKTSLLKGDQCLSTLIKYYGQDEQIIDENIQVIKEYLQKNKNAGGIHIGLDQDLLLNSLGSLCQKVVTLKTVTEKDLIQEANTGKNKRNAGKLQGGNKKPITILARLKSPLDPQKGLTKKQKYQSPFKEKRYKIQRTELRSNKSGQIFQSGY